MAQSKSSPVFFETDSPSCSCPASDDCRLPLDVVIRCSDGKVHGAHVRNLELYSSRILSLNLSEMCESTESIEVDEDSQTIALLCKFMHRQVQPDVFSIPWEDFLKLASAAEKYGVYNAMGVCKLKMEYSLQEHPYDVLQYAAAAKYESLRDRAMALCLETHPLECFVKAHELDLTELRDKAAVKTLNLSVAEVVSALKGKEGWRSVLIAWIMQRDERHKRLLHHLTNPPNPAMHKGGVVRCDDWNCFYNDVIIDYTKRADGNLRAAVTSNKRTLGQCGYCLKAIELWEKNIESIIGSLPPFSTLCDF